MQCRHTVAACLLALCILPAWPPGRATAATSPEQLERLIADMAAQIRATQAADGSLGGPHQYIVGQTALGLMALRAAGAPPDDPVVLKAAAYLARMTPNDIRQHGVYQVSLRAIALSNVNPVAYRKQIQECADYLANKAQMTKGAAKGGWSYRESGAGDYSNSQFAVLGLNAVAMSGIKVPSKHWTRAREYFLKGQFPNGAWSYRPGDRNIRATMTCAGTASVYICNLWLHVANGRCGVYLDDAPVEGGLSWLVDNFTVRGIPYYLYALERAGVIMAQRYFGPHDWYRQGVDYLHGTLRAPGGGVKWEGQFYDNCFRLLFLGKGNAPLLIHKAAWGRTGRGTTNRNWNRHRFDAKFLIHFSEQEFERLLDWQIVRLDAPLEELMAAPILYVSGSGWPDWTEKEIARIKEYVTAGGFMLVEPAGGDAVFNRGFREFIKNNFPDDELQSLPRDHPIYTSRFDIPANQRPPLQAVMGPCWISILYCPHGISCPWDIARFDHPYFKMGVNIISYVVDPDELKGKLVKPEFEVPELEEAKERRGAFVMAQLAHKGDWQPHKIAWRRVLQDVNKKAGLRVYNRPVPVQVGVDDPYQGQMLYLVGARELKLTKEEKELLRDYIERGGFIFAEAACSSPVFDRSFRRLMEELFPAQALADVPPTHALYKMGEQLGPMAYSEGMLRQMPNASGPMLEMIEQGGRAVIVYSKYDISSAIEGHPCHKCPSVLEPSASRLALKIVLYGLSS